jgi:hypothetical protein
MESLVRQAIWTPFYGEPNQALKTKRDFLKDSPFPVAVQARVTRLWQKGMKKRRVDGLGRFTNFQQGWYNLYESGKLTREFLEVLRTVHERTADPAAAVDAARTFAARTDVPMVGTPRFSEALHLSQPEVFPFVNNLQNRVLAQILGIPPNRLINDRRIYFDHLEQIKKLCAWQELDGYNALDVFLIDLGRHRPLFRAVQKQFAMQRPVAKAEIEDMAVQLEREGAFAYDSASETVRRVAVRAIAVRSGQVKFRSRLLRAYSGRCAMTGCDAEAALEAAHIRPYSREGTNDLPNGLLLRADVHLLFDMGLVAVNTENWTIMIARALQNTQYQALAGKTLHRPRKKNAHPDKTLLYAHMLGSKIGGEAL